MSDDCPNPLPWDTLVEYWNGELSVIERDRVEEHLFGCSVCMGEAARAAAVTETLREMIPPVVSRERVDRLRATGVRLHEGGLLPGERREVVFGMETDLMIHRLGGLDLSNAERVSCQIMVKSTGETLAFIEDAPFERDEGAVLIALQRDFVSQAGETRFELSIYAPGRPVGSASYVVVHRFP